MADVVTPNMSLTLPTISQTVGPTYAQEINTDLSTIDTHNHTTGQGVQIPATGININSDLPFNGANATILRSVRFQSQASTLGGGSDLRCIYAVGVDFYLNDGNGTQIRLTQSGGITGSPGSITNLSSPASASYTSNNSTFVWQSAANTPANLDCASILMRNLSANSSALTLQPPTAMGANFSVTLPSIASQTSFIQLDTSGNMLANVTVDNLSVVLGTSSSKISVGTGLTTNNLAANAGITSAQNAGCNSWSTSSNSGSYTNGQVVLRITGFTAATGTRPVFWSYAGGGIVIPPQTSVTFTTATGLNNVNAQTVDNSNSVCSLSMAMSSLNFFAVTSPAHVGNVSTLAVTFNAGTTITITSPSVTAMQI